MYWEPAQASSWAVTEPWTTVGSSSLSRTLPDPRLPSRLPCPFERVRPWLAWPIVEPVLAA